MPLSSDINTKVISAWNTTISTLGHTGTLNTVAGQSSPITFGFAKPRDEAIINNYSENARVITIRKMDVGTIIPEVDDEIVFDGREYTIQEIAEVHVNNMHVGWRGVAQG